MTQNANGAFALDNVQMALSAKRDNRWGGSLIPLNMLTGSRPVMREAPLSKQAKKMVAEGKDTRKEFKLKKFKPFKGQNCGADRQSVEAYIDNVITDANNLQMDKAAVSKNLNYLIAACFHKRDIQDGAGERDLSYFMFIKLYSEFPEIMGPLLKLLAFDYGSLLDLNKISCIIATDLAKKPAPEDSKKASLGSLKAEILNVYAAAFDDDSQQINAAKWAPRINKSVDRISGLAKDLAEKLFPAGENRTQQAKDRSHKLYRQKLAKFNTKTIETKMCANDLTYIGDNLSKIPGKAMSKYRYSYLDEFKCGEKAKQRKRPLEDDRTELRQKLLDLTKKAIENPELNLIKGGKTMQPHEIVAGILDNHYQQDYQVNPVHEAQWAALRETTKQAGSLTNTVVMSDVSGSMNGIPMQVSIALGLLIAEIQEGAWANRLMTFSSSPCWFSLPDDKNAGLLEKVKAIAGMDWGYSTDLEKCMMLILNLAIDNKIPKEEMPKNFIILTDMCFNSAAGGNGKLQMEVYKERFEAAGYDFPVIILWNLRSSDISFQNEATTPGVVNLAGFSIALLKSILSGDQLDLSKMSPLDMLLTTLSKERYDKVFEEIKKNSGKGQFSGFEKWSFEDESNYNTVI